MYIYAYIYIEKFAPISLDMFVPYGGFFGYMTYAEYLLWMEYADTLAIVEVL